MPWSFYIMAGFTIISALAAMSLRNLIHCALSLALSFLGVAGLFLQMDSGFLAFAQILVYVGAVAILIVFAILLTRDGGRKEDKRASHLWMNIPIALSIGLIFIAAINSTDLPAPVPDKSTPSVLQLGEALMTSHVLPLQITGLLLTVALLGAVILALPEKEAKLNQ